MSPDIRVVETTVVQHGGSRRMNSPVHLSKFEKVVPGGKEWLLTTRDWVVLQVSEGVAYVFAGDIKKELATAEVVVCPPQTTLKLLASVLGNALFRGLAICISSLTGFLTAMERRCLETEAPRQLAPFLTLNPGHPLAERLALLLSNSAAMSLPNRLAFVQTFAELLAPQLREAVKKDDAANRGEQDAKSRLRQLMHQMPETELAGLSLTQMAQQIHCCERHTSRLFQEVWGSSFRSFVADLRLKKACQLLVEGRLKVIDVALDSGHGSLAHFNYVFKRRLHLTPTEWRNRHLKGAPPSSPALGKSAKRTQNAPARGKPGPARKAGSVIPDRAATPPPSGEPPLPDSERPFKAQTLPVAATLILLLFVLGSFCAVAADALPAKSGGGANQSTAARAEPHFKVERYEVSGDTLLSSNLIQKILSPYTSDTASLDTIKKAGGALQLAYRERGYPTIKVALPPQKITNGIVRFQVTEGKLSAVRVVHNRFFSSNNVMRALPGLKYGSEPRILNGKVFQAELDRANANPDRQISPEIRPGREPGTSELVLDVKDRLPFHGQLEFDNHNPPDTPSLRLNLNLSYNNLWQLDHAIGFQYGASPERLKETLDVPHMVLAPVDWPAVAYYSGFYRAPLAPPEAVQAQIERDQTHFGYNEATHQFALPPATGRPEVTFYASRTTTGTPLQTGPYQLVTQTSLQTINDQAFSTQYTSQTTVGVRLTVPVPVFWGVSSSLSLGPDYKDYRSVTLATNFFYVSTITTNSSGHQVITHTTIPVGGNTFPTVDYMPLSLAWTGSRPDHWGEYDGSLSAIFGTGGWFHADDHFPHGIVYSEHADVNFVVLRPQMSRSLHLPGNFTFYANLAGQWADDPLINLEQSPLGGVATVRGYKEGERYGDDGWLLQGELRSPTVWFGKLGKGKLFGVEITAFNDYGQSRLLDPAPGQPAVESLWGTGVGLNFFLGPHLESHLLVARALRDGDFTRAGTERIETSVSGQF